MAVLLRALSAFIEDPDWIPSTCMVVHTCVHLQFQEIQHLLTSAAPGMHMVQIHPYRQNFHTLSKTILKIRNLKLKKPTKCVPWGVCRSENNCGSWFSLLCA